MSATGRLEELNRKIDQLRVARTVLRKKIRLSSHIMAQYQIDSENRKMDRYTKSIDDYSKLRDQLLLRIEKDRLLKIQYESRIPDLPIGINPIFKMI